MTCETISIPGGGRAIVCGPRRRCACGGRATRLCDWKVPSRRSGTCDKPLCDRCATAPAPDKDLCPVHADAFVAWQAARPLTTVAAEAGR